MRSYMRKNNNFSRVLEPVNERFVSAEHVVTLTSSQCENIERISFSPPKIGDSGFGKFKITYITPVLCEANQ